MAIEIVDFPMNSMVIFHGKMLVHQRVAMENDHFLWVNQLYIYFDWAIFDSYFDITRGYLFPLFKHVSRSNA